MQTKSQEHQELIKDLQQLFYPVYPPNSSVEEFLSHYDNLFEWLKMVDEISLDDVKKFILQPKLCIGPNITKIQDSEKIVYFIIDLLNKLCTYCHRKQLRQKIFSQLKTYKKNLKGIPIGKNFIKISQWQAIYKYQSKAQNFSTANSQQLQKDKKQKEILRILDQLYLQYRRIPNIYSLLLTQPMTLQKISKFQQSLIIGQKSTKTNIPLTHKFYLGIIAASTFGSRYLWNMMAQKFVKAGGNINWLIQGLEEAPNHIKKLSQMSYMIAYNFKLAVLEQKCYQICDQKQFNSAMLIEGLYILSYYHFLACFSLVHGLIPQSSQYEQYLPQIPNISPSMESFQTIKKASKREQIHQKQVAEQFTQMYSWDANSEVQLQKHKSIKVLQRSSSFNNNQIKRVKISEIDDKKSNLSDQTTQCRERIDSQSENEFVVIIEEQQILNKIKNSKTMKNIEAIFHKYVPFDERMSGIQFKHRKRSRNSNIQYGSTEVIDNEESQPEFDFIYASEWNFEDNAAKRIESVLGKTINNQLNGTLQSLRFLPKEKRKNLKIYYESLQNYMYQYVSYIQLVYQFQSQMSQGVSLVEKNYIKLITRSPFLYNQKSYKKMAQDLKSNCQIESAFQFCLQILSYKLELNFSMVTYIYDKYIQNQE